VDDLSKITKALRFMQECVSWESIFTRMEWLSRIQ